MKYSTFIFVGAMMFLSACGKYERVHRAIYDDVSDARLQLLARQSVSIADTLGLTNALFYLRGSSSAPIPAEFIDLDPTTVTIYSDRVNVELAGGFDHFGFNIERSEADTNIWTISKYDESHSTVVDTYKDIGSHANTLVPKGDQGIREP